MCYSVELLSPKLKNITILSMQLLINNQPCLHYSIWNMVYEMIPVGARFSAPVQKGPEAHPASCTMGTVSFPGVSCCRGVTLTPHPLLVPKSKIK